MAMKKHVTVTCLQEAVKLQLTLLSAQNRLINVVTDRELHHTEQQRSPEAQYQQTNELLMDFAASDVYVAAKKLNTAAQKIYAFNRVSRRGPKLVSSVCFTFPFFFSCVK